MRQTQSQKNTAPGPGQLISHQRSRRQMERNLGQAVLPFIPTEPLLWTFVRNQLGSFQYFNYLFAFILIIINKI